MKKHKFKHFRFIIPGVILLISIVIIIIFNINHKSSTQKNVNKNAPETNAPTILNKEDFVKMVNSERNKQGTGGLSNDEKLDKAAFNRANDMLAKDYYDTTTGDPWSFVNQVDYQYSTVSTLYYHVTVGSMRTNEVFRWFMDSPDNKERLLSSNYSSVGYGLATNSVGSSVMVLYLANPRISSTQSVNPAAPPSSTYGPSNAYSNPYKYSVPLYTGGTYSPPPVNISPVTPPPPTTPPPPSTPQYTYSQALSISQSNCAAYNGSSAYQQCINAYMHKFGY
jgi:hypothetical protein